ncbi:MAG: aminopeptidase [Chloroflexi bacterium]|nr:aminopeptidase [Chloroflexota bacterium]
MADTRIQRLADILVNYSTKVQPGEWVGILGDVAALPLLREVHDAVVKAGGNPSVMFTDEYMTRSFARHANDEQVAWLDPAQSQYYDNADVYPLRRAAQHPRQHQRRPGAPAKIAAARRRWLDTRMRRAAEGKMKWVGTLFPTEGSAQEANMSLEEYETSSSARPCRPGRAGGGLAGDGHDAAKED